MAFAGGADRSGGRDDGPAHPGVQWTWARWRCTESRATPRKASRTATPEPSTPAPAERRQTMQELIASAEADGAWEASIERLAENDPTALEAVAARSSIEPLDWQPDADVVGKPVEELKLRLEVLRRLLGSAAEDAAAGVLAQMQRGQRVDLPQDPAFELLTLVAWSMLPPVDRAVLACGNWRAGHYLGT